MNEYNPSRRKVVGNEIHGQRDPDLAGKMEKKRECERQEPAKDLEAQLREKCLQW